MSATSCPDDAELLALADGGEVPGTLEGHLADCPGCLSRYGRLRGEVSSLRILRPGAATAAGPAGYPSFVGKYFIAGVGAEEAGLVSLRGVHSVVGQEVTILLGRTPEPADPASRMLLKAGFQPLIRFKDPRFARVYDFDFFEDVPYLAVESAPGRDVEMPSDPLKRLAIFAELARGLESAHRAGLVHGRIGPGRLSLDEHGHYRLAGLGAAQLAGKDRKLMTPDRDVADLGTVLLGILDRGADAGRHPARLGAIADRIKAGGYGDAGTLADDLERASRPRSSRALGVAGVAFTLIAIAAIALRWLARSAL